MPSLLPGINPYLEQPHIWPDVHAGLITAMRNYLQPRIVPRYIARITPYIAVEQIEIAPARRAVVPDVGIYERDHPPVAPGTGTIDAAPLTDIATMDISTRYARIEIRVSGDDTVVTAIELLSPTF